jgi:hypothetical protein
MSKPKSGGWQVDIEYYDKHVIKTPKSKKDTEKAILKYVELNKKQSKFKKLVKNAKEDLENSIRIVQNSKIPNELLASPEFLDGGKIKQERVTVLDDIFSELIKWGKIDDAKRLIDDILNFMVGLWKYGIHETTFKFYSGYGRLGEKIVLIDFGEMTDDFEKVKKQILGKGPTFDYLKESYTEDIINYFLGQKEKRLTVKALEKNWNIHNSKLK